MSRREFIHNQIDYSTDYTDDECNDYSMITTAKSTDYTIASTLITISLKNVGNHL